MTKKNSSEKIYIEKIEWDSKNSHNNYQTIIEVLAHDIDYSMKEEKIKFDFICGVPRGGLIPAVHLSHLLGIPYMEFSNEAINANNILFVEDIVHSGRSMKQIPLEHPVLQNKLVAIVRNEISGDNDSVWKHGIEVGSNVWIKFPWENEITVLQAIKKAKKHILYKGE